MKTKECNVLRTEAAPNEDLETLTIIRKVKISGTWKDIAAKIRKNSDGLQIGDAILDQFKDGTAVEWVVTDVTDEYVRFESRDCIGTHCINDTYTNKGGIAESEMQEYLDEEVFGNLSEELQKVISEVNRKYMDGAEVKEFPTKLFLSSVSEVFEKGIAESYGEKDLYEQLEFYKNRRNRVKDYRNGGVSACWWLSSPYSISAIDFCVVTTTGGTNYANVTYAYSVVPSFIIKKS